jgi:enamine deaminase RidA (YjgF/YER057c/UK114 family)
MYVTDMDNAREVARAHGEVFSSILPVTALVQVVGLIDPAMLVEIEADAVITE